MDPSLEKFLPPYGVAVLLTLVAQFALFLRWLYRQVRNEELLRAFVQDIATNHLPHIYVLLAKLCDHAGIDRDAAPLIRWIELNSHNKP